MALTFAVLLAVVQTVRGALFALYPDHPEHAIFTFDSFQRHHSCFTAYFEAARLVRHVRNVYDERHYLAPEGGPMSRPSWQSPTDRRRTVSVFYVDPYEYPPPFLLLSRVFVALSDDFLRARAMWFFFQTALLIGALTLLARHVQASVGGSFALPAVLIYLSLPAQISLQIGNFQALAITLAMASMVLMACGRAAIGAPLLSFVILSKLFPGALLLTLAGRRTLRPLLWTLAWLGVWVVLGVTLHGWAPFEAFWRYHLPRVGSGEAFPQLRIPYAIAINQSVQAIPLKLAFFGIGSGSQRLGASLAWLYTLVPVGVAILVRRAAYAPLAWAVVLALATYRSPFLPQEYASLGPVIVLCLLTGGTPMSRRRWMVFAACFILLQLQVPWGVSHHPVLGSVVNGVAQAVAAGVLGVALHSLAATTSTTSMMPRHSQGVPDGSK